MVIYREWFAMNGKVFYGEAISTIQELLHVRVVDNYPFTCTIDTKSKCPLPRQIGKAR